MKTERALGYARRHRERFVTELKEFVAFPSVSLNPAHARDVENCAAWLARKLRSIGLEHATTIVTRGHPVVYADWLHAPRERTLLIYGHYDVVPADPLREWKSSPYNATVRGDNLYGRGASDDKGQMFAHVKALEAYLQSLGRLPINVKCIFEGEEEIDSPNFAQFLGANKRSLGADIGVMSDNQMLAPDRPVINYGVRGNLRLELEIEGPSQDLHSGTFGGAIHNPLQVVCDVLSTLHDEDGRVAIAGFYDDVRPFSREERRNLSQTAPSDEELLRSARAKRGWGERGYTLYERTAIRPALTLNGITGGSQGAGVKMVIPSRALAKLSVRLVPDQDPKQIEQLFRGHVARNAPATVKATVRMLSSAQPALLDRDDPGMRAAAAAFKRGFGSAPVFLRSGGTFPVVSMLKQLLGINTVLMGFALPDDHLHSPNENFHLPNFYRGIETCIWFLTALASRCESAEGEPHQAWSMAYGN